MKAVWTQGGGGQPGGGSKAMHWIRPSLPTDPPVTQKRPHLTLLTDGETDDTEERSSFQLTRCSRESDLWAGPSRWRHLHGQQLGQREGTVSVSTAPYGFRAGVCVYVCACVRVCVRVCTCAPECTHLPFHETLSPFTSPPSAASIQEEPIQSPLRGACGR